MATSTIDPPAAGLARHAAPAASRAAWTGFGVVLAAAVMDLLDSTIAQTAAPAIRRELGGSYATLEWTTAAYTLAMATSLLLGGRLGDLFGRRRVLLAGMGAFAGASALCALAPSADALIAARGLQGASAAIMVPQCFGIIRELFGDEGQQRAFSVFGPVMGLAAVAGPLLGGAIVDLDVLGTGWRGIFLVNIPVAAARDRRGPAGAAAHRAGGLGPAPRRAERPARDGRRRRARLPARRGARARLAGLVHRAPGRGPRALRRVLADAGAPLRARGDDARRAVRAAPPPVRRWPRARRLLHRRDGRHGPGAQRDVPDRVGLLAARLRHRHGGDPAGRDRRLDRLVDPRRAPRAEGPVDRPGDHGDRPADRRPRPARAGRRRQRVGPSPGRSPSPGWAWG